MESEDGFPKPTCGDAATGLMVAKPIDEFVYLEFVLSLKFCDTVLLNYLKNLVYVLQRSN